MKTCSKCNKNKKLEEFTKSKSNVNYTRKGQTLGYHAYCKVCNAMLARERRLKYKKTNGVNPESVGRLKDVPTELKPIMSLIRHRFACARSRIAKKNLIPTDLDEIYLLQLMKDQNFKCRYTNLDFIFEKHHLLCPSLDQIVPSKGYIKGNVQWLSWATNWSKGDMDECDFLAMCKLITKVDKK